MTEPLGALTFQAVLFFDQTKSIGDDEALAVVVLDIDDTHAVEGDNNLGGGFLADVCQLHVSVQGDATVGAQVVEQDLLAFAIADGLGGMFLCTLGLLTQDALMQAAGKDCALEV